MSDTDYYMQDLFERAELLEKKGEWLKAMQLYHRLLTEREEDPAVQLRLAAVYTEMGNYGAAERLLLTMLGSDNSNTDILYALGMVFFRAEQYDQTVYYLEKIAGQSNPRIHFSLGFAFLKMERWFEAERHLKRALEIDPTLPRGYQLLCELYLHLRQGTQAKAAAELARAQNPEEPYLGLLLAHSYMVLEEWREALDLYLSLHARIPVDPAPLLGASEAAMQLREYDRAILLLQEYLVLKPEDADIYSRLGHLYVVKNRKSLAKQCFDRALEIDPENSEALEHLHLLRTPS